MSKKRQMSMKRRSQATATKIKKKLKGFCYVKLTPALCMAIHLLDSTSAFYVRMSSCQCGTNCIGEV